MNKKDLSFGWGIWFCGKQIGWFSTEYLMLKKLNCYEKEFKETIYNLANN